MDGEIDIDSFNIFYYYRKKYMRYDFFFLAGGINFYIADKRYNCCCFFNVILQNICNSSVYRGCVQIPYDSISYHIIKPFISISHS